MGKNPAALTEVTPDPPAGAGAHPSRTSEVDDPCRADIWV